MNRGFYIIMAAQFCSALADNALLIAAIWLLIDFLHRPEFSPLLKFYFTVSYVVLAPFVGAFADSMPKGRVMLISNTIKILGCLLLLFNIHPLLAYGIVGLGAAAYSPAKYGILTELLPPNQLVLANAWIEGLTVAAIILGTMVGGVLINPTVSAQLAQFDLPGITTGIDTAPEMAISVIAVFYVLAALFNLYVPNTGVDHKPVKRNPWFLVRDFSHCVKLLWMDKLGQISLAVTTLFWAAGATLQFIVLDWAKVALGLSLDKASMLQGVVAIGVAIGAITAARIVPIHKSVKVLPVGALMGVFVISMVAVSHLPLAMILMISIGAIAGFFVVPMNALLQHRGHILVGAGHSIAVQNFNENAGILVMVGTYYLLQKADVSVNGAVIIFGLFVSTIMLFIMNWHRCNITRHGAEIEKLLDVARTSTHP
ncbi:MAG: lysophospholipid transporter LplT [Betaproteobacteria bacterium RBG_19FT_COMBO_58_11]|nr:MAG: lysophospholipid transporter LplT [Betaproteobacteria bacterium RBG_19FT_COMBO_58_11]